MATSRSCIKYLKIICEMVFTVSGGWNSATCTYEINSFPEVLYKRSDLKNFSKFSDKHKDDHPEVFCQKMLLKILKNSQKNIVAGVSLLLKLHAGNLKLSEAATGDVL